jgi:hypothetical protein
MSIERGRHRNGRPGLTRRERAAGPRRRPRHRRVVRRRVTAEGMSLVVTLIAIVAIAVSGWYAATGATAVAQMLAR